jgi:hypothetical protein
MTDKTRFVSTVKHRGVLYEQCYDRARKKSFFIGLNSSDLSPKLAQITINDIVYKPISDGLRDEEQILAKGVVLLPSKPVDYGTVLDLVTEINNFIYRYLDISDEHRKHTTWYILLSWVLDNLNTIPYLRALGDYGTGKTRYLDVIGGLCYKPMFVGGSVRSAPVFRIIDRWHGTPVLDEFNLDRSDDSSDIIQILNGGYQRGKCILRCGTSDKEFGVGAFDTFGTKVIATRKRFTDKALESRCITEILTETSRKDVPIELPSVFYSEREQLRNKLLMYRFKNWDKINIKPVSVDFGYVQPRIKQSMLPFTVLFSHDEEELAKFKTEVIKRNAQIVRDNSMTTEGFIVRAYQCLLDKPYITVKMLKILIEDELGWEGDLSSRKIGKILRSLGFEIKSEHIKVVDETHRNVKIDANKLRLLSYRYNPEMGD